MFPFLTILNMFLDLTLVGLNFYKIAFTIMRKNPDRTIGDIMILSTIFLYKFSVI